MFSLEKALLVTSRNASAGSDNKETIEFLWQEMCVHIDRSSFVLTDSLVLRHAQSMQPPNHAVVCGCQDEQASRPLAS